MATKEKPACEALMTWLRANLGTLAALTGTDMRALHAASHIIELYAFEGDARLLAAFATVVERMQPSTLEFAYHAIAFRMDWNDRARVWALAGLPSIMTRRCVHEGAAA